jgi:hypothetical protein
MSSTGGNELVCCPLAVVTPPEGGGERSQQQNLVVVRCDCEVQINVVVASVTLRLVYRNASARAVSGVFKAGNAFGQATVTSCDMRYSGQHLVTAVIDPNVVSIDSGKNSQAPQHSEYQDLLHFILPFTDLGAGCEMAVEMSYIQNMAFTRARFYELTVPLSVPKELMAQGMTSEISCKIDVGSVNCVWEVPTHPMEVTAQDAAYLALQCSNTSTNSHFHLKINALSNAVAGSCSIQPNEPYSDRPGGSFMVFVTPPEERFLPPVKIGRNMVI